MRRTHVSRAGPRAVANANRRDRWWRRAGVRMQSRSVSTAVEHRRVDPFCVLRQASFQARFTASPMPVFIP